MADKESGHRAEPHTADLRIEAWAPTRDGCIRQAVLGTVESFLETSGVRPQHTCQHRLTGDRDDDLLVAGGFIELPELQRRGAEVSSRRKELQHKRTSLADERAALARDNQLRSRVHDFATRVHAIIDHLDDTQKQQLLRLLVEDVRVTGWHVQIRLRIALDPPPSPEPPHPTGPPSPTGPTGKPAPNPHAVSTQDGSSSVSDHRRSGRPPRTDQSTVRVLLRSRRSEHLQRGCCNNTFAATRLSRCRGTG